MRWVVEVPLQGRRIDPSAPPSPGLRPVIVTTDISLHAVPGWAPARRVADGAPVEVDRPVAPILRTDPAAVRVAAPGSGGWRRSGEASISADGLLELPGGGGTAWYPGAAAVLVADVTALVLAGLCARRLRATRGGRGTERQPLDEGG